ncbi:MAG TPA: hypothetical protein VLZ74_03670 [Methylocella sp.]|nr:hypothetical protein [Methylocella sp.]
MTRIIERVIFAVSLVAILAFGGLLLREYISEQQGSDVVGFEMRPLHKGQNI